MSFSIRRVSKYARWVKNLSSNYNNNKKIGHEYARCCRNESIYSLLGNTKKEKYWAEAKHRWVEDYIKSAVPETIKKYSNCERPNNLFAMQDAPTVWSMWWQGEEQADKLFRMCIASARQHINQPVTVLSKNNYQKYFDLPDYIIKKFEEGKIQIQHICDLMFVSILAEQGGLFTGATVYWSQDIDEDTLKAPFFSPRAVDWNATAVSKFRWTGYLMGGNKEFPLFQFARDALFEYWENHDLAVDYLLLDYIFNIAYDLIPCVKELIDSLPEQNNMDRNELIKHLSDPYNEESFQRFCQGNTKFYKLSWKFGAKDLLTSDGRVTNYGHMLREAGLTE